MLLVFAHRQFEYEKMALKLNGNLQCQCNGESINCCREGFLDGICSCMQFDKGLLPPHSSSSSKTPPTKTGIDCP